MYVYMRVYAWMVGILINWVNQQLLGFPDKVHSSKASDKM